MQSVKRLHCFFYRTKWKNNISLCIKKSGTAHNVDRNGYRPATAERRFYIMKRFRKYTAGLLLLVLVLGVSACGNSDNNGGTNKPNTENNGTTNNGANTNGTTNNGNIVDDAVDGAGDAVEDVGDGIMNGVDDVVDGTENVVDDMTNGTTNTNNGTTNQTTR